MAGIGFELRRLLKQDSYLGLLRAYGYAALIGSGPWVISILAVMTLGILAAAGRGDSPVFITDFLVSVTWLVAGSLIFTGPLQLTFTRFTADRLYEGRDDEVLPSLKAVLTLTTVGSLLAAITIASILANASPLAYRVLMVMGFVLLCNLWCVAVFVAGVKRYRQVLAAFALGYATTLGLGLCWQGLGITGLLGAFVIGQALLLFVLLAMVTRHYPSQQPWSMALLIHGRWQPKLVAIGLFYNLGVWIDKLAFWFHPATSVPMIAPLRAAPLYDLPLFLAYLSIVPGMAIFLMRIETDFALNSQRYDLAIRSGRSLEEIESWRRAMVISVRRGIYDIIKVQGVTVAALLLAGPHLLEALGFSDWNLPIFNLLLVAVAIQVLFLAILNVLFYLDRLTPALWLCVAFCASNLGFTLITQHLGPDYYGYGYALSLLLVAVIGLLRLDREFQRLTFHTFMRRR
ncbi:exopolysaccharide Pel transporter PelG [Halomonas litopenaei]|uniref:exopolysaccharide Pel transporter PelG n=1 Tax=Halomonas litopenaei TaxID=2109328 RepID=UPI000C5284FC|nr:histidine kinase [Halomonas sp.]